jgi:predicted lipoprotein with Yx(FWY)xxD motif
MRRFLSIGLLAAALGGLGCGDDESNAEESPQAAQPAVQAEAESKPVARKQPDGVTIKTAPSQFGKVLFSGSDRAIYYFDKESTSKPECYGDCARAWPPVLTKGKPQAAGRVKQGLLGTRKRSNGKRQVTYDGHPLYFYIDDPEGEVLCHNITEFGGLWLAVKPGGGTPPT